MMHRCSREPCPCGPFGNQSASSFSMLFSKPFDENDLYYSSSPSSSVDCTLSLGTPSTRLVVGDDASDDHYRRNGAVGSRPEQHRRSSVSNFCWDVFQPKHAAPSKAGRGGGNQSSSSSSASAASDPLLARRCANCDTTSTPLWRNGPRGPKVCCGLIMHRSIDTCVWTCNCCIKSCILALSFSCIVYDRECFTCVVS